MGYFDDIAPPDSAPSYIATPPGVPRITVRPSFETGAARPPQDEGVELPPRTAGLFDNIVAPAAQHKAAIERALSASADTDLLVLGNHGLVIGGPDCRAAEDLLREVRYRLTIPARRAHPADYAVLAEIADRWSWDLPDDDDVHALGTDPISRVIVSGGLLYPCQAIFSNASSAKLYSFHVGDNANTRRCCQQLQHLRLVALQRRVTEGQ